ncbi:uncharacterized protein PV06_09586 [Exophiala oligosperma]|nr:uncharacterized protein PV06_09586 [Exophiala oligosperma]KIW38633.1 hypothetical protein PV06_09586 [Exophiala oligosperma]
MATKNQLSDAAKSLDRVESHDGLELGQASSLPEEAHFDEKTAATIRHRIDLRLIPLLGAIYGISLMDRTNMPNAAIAGMLTDLKLSHGPRYNLVNMSFFITYILLQPVMVIIGRKVGPRTFLPSICLAWGAVIIGFGFAKNWPTLLPLRLLLGAMEAGYFPGCLYLLSCWYTRFEVARRYSSFYLIGSVSSALSGILAYGLQQLDGLANLSGWRWIFIMEGVITCAIASFAFIFLVKFPDKERVKPSWGFLSPDQLEFQIERLNAERRDVELEDLTWKRFFQPATEWYIYGFPFILFLINVTAYAFAFTLPIILRSKLGFNVAMAQCLVAPPYVLAGAIMYLVAWY